MDFFEFYMCVLRYVMLAVLESLVLFVFVFQGSNALAEWKLVDVLSSQVIIGGALWSWVWYEYHTSGIIGKMCNSITVIILFKHINTHYVWPLLYIYISLVDSLKGRQFVFEEFQHLITKKRRKRQPKTLQATSGGHPWCEGLPLWGKL